MLRFSRIHENPLNEAVFVRKTPPPPQKKNVQCCQARGSTKTPVHWTVYILKKKKKNVEDLIHGYSNYTKLTELCISVFYTFNSYDFSTKTHADTISLLFPSVMISHLLHMWLNFSTLTERGPSLYVAHDVK